MKAAKGSIFRTVDQPPPDLRFYLFYGPDEGQSRSLGERLLKGLGASRFVLSASAIRSDPAALADEAGAMSLFGGTRAIWIEPAGDDTAAGVEALLGSTASESPVIAIGGALRKTSALLKLADAHPLALSHASYVPEGPQAERMVIDVGRSLGLRMIPAVASRIGEACGNDQAIVSRELEKISIYLDSAPERPKELDHGALDAIGAALPEGDFLRLADLALAGNLAELSEELSRLEPGGTEAIPVIRALQRRILQLAPMRARMDQGESASAVMASMGKSLFWKDKQVLEPMLRAWDAPALETVAERAGRLERQMMLSGLPPTESLGEELFAIARAARRR